MEELNNEDTVVRERGEIVTYGKEIQLVHESSGQFLQMSRKNAVVDKTCSRLELATSPMPSRAVWSIMPRYKYRQEGNMVVYND